MVTARDASHKKATRLALFGVFAIALLARSLGFEQVFQDDGTVVFTASDAFYHVRRILFGIAHFPEVLRFDPCLNWPQGSVVPHPPIYDTAAAMLARLLSPVPPTTVLAWLPVALGALAVFPIYALGRNLRGPGIGLAAALLFATLPIAVNYAQVGNPDHHAAVALLGACLLWLYTSFLDPTCRGPRLAGVVLGLAVLRFAVLGTWHGSALLLIPGEAALLIYCVVSNRRDLFLAEAASALLSAALIAPWIFFSLTPKAGPWSATELSFLHLLGLVSVAFLCMVSLGLARSMPNRPQAIRLLHLGLLTLGEGLVALAFPVIREGLEPALNFIAKRDAWGNSVMEQLPLFFMQGEFSRHAGEIRMGYYAYLLPLLPLAFVGLSREPAKAARGLFLFGWSFLFAGLTLYQLRFANEVAPVACTGFALLLLQGAQWLSNHTPLRPRIAKTLAVGLGCLLAWPGIDLYFRPFAQASLDHLVGNRSLGDRALKTLSGTQVRFAQKVREVTPPTAGCESHNLASQRPDYGILAHPSLGHVLHQIAGRATPADPFGPYIGETNFRRVTNFLHTDSETEALALAQTLESPFVATAADVGNEGLEDSIHYRLQVEDGSATATQPHLEHFRLLAEAPRGGVPLDAVFDSEAWSEVPFKLFEIVPGAVVRFPAPSGETVEAALGVATLGGRRFIYRAWAVAETDGFARLRLPYTTGLRGEVNTSPSYQLRSPTRRGWVEVSEAAVRGGLTVSPGLQGETSENGAEDEPPERS